MRGSLLALAILWAFSTLAYDQNDYLVAGGKFDSKQIQQARDRYISGAVDLDFEWLKQLIRSSGAQTIEEFLPHLPENLRASYTLMKASGSLQQSSPMNPRAIVFAHDASLVLTFNGSEKHTGYNSLEVLEFSEADKKFRLFEVDFSKKGENRFSAPNPAKCMSCHAAWPKPHGAVKPIWSSYSHWLGAYGERDDHFVDVMSHRGGEYEGVTSNPEYDYKEFNEYQQFVKLSENHPRYKHLVRRTQFSPAAPYILHSSDTFKDKGTSWIQRKVINMPNLRLAKVLDANNSRRVAAHILAHPRFEDLKWRVLFQNLCQGMDFKAQWEMVELDDFDLSLNDLNIVFNESQSIYHNGNPSQKASDMIIHKIYLHMMESDEALKKFYKKGSPFEYYANFGFPSNESTRMKSQSLSDRPESYQYSYVWAEVFSDLSGVVKKISPKEISQKEICSHIASHIEMDERITNTTLAPFFRPPLQVQMRLSRTQTPQQILTSCAECHDSGLGYAPLATAPYYPFGSERALKSYLSRLRKYNMLDKFLNLVDQETQPNTTVVYSNESVSLSEAFRYQRMMPLGRERLTDVERQRLIEHFSTLSDL